MKKKISSLVLLLVFAMQLFFTGGVITPYQTVRAEEGVAENKPPIPAGGIAGRTPQFVDRFNNGLMAWTAKGTCSVTEDERLLLASVDTVNDISLKGTGAVWGDQTVMFTFKRLEAKASNFSSVSIRAANGDSFRLLIRDSSISYKLGAAQEVRLAEYQVERNTDYQIILTAKGSSVNVQIKQKKENRFKDLGTVQNVTAKRGKISFYTINCTMAVDDLEVYNDEIGSAFVLADKMTFINLNEKKKLALTNNTGASVKWSSSDENVATVTQDGEVTMLKKGNATITAEAGDLKDTCEVVGIALLQSIKLSSTELEIEEGNAMNLAAAMTPSNADNSTLVWTSGDQSVATLVGSASKARGVKGLKIGKAVISVSSLDGKLSQVCNVTVVPKKEHKPSTAKFKADGAVSPFNPGVYGFSHTLVNRINTTRDFNSTSNLEVMKGLHVKSLRGPDGTPANYFFAAKGLTMSSKDPQYATLYGDKIVGDTYSYVKDGYPTLTPDAIFKASNDLDVPYIYNLNISGQTVDEIVAACTEMKKVTNKPLLLELGNELYDTYGMHAFPTVETYVQKCREITKAVKAKFPDTKFGAILLSRPGEMRIVNDPQNMSYGTMEIDWGSTFVGRIYNWNTTVAANPDFYDAIIVHDYTNLVSVNKLDEDGVMQHFATYNMEMEEGCLEQAAQFPGKEMWVTEWGTLPEIVFSEKDQSERARFQMMRSPGFAVHDLEKFLYFIKMGMVTYSSYHCIVDGQGFGVTSGGVLFPIYHAFSGLGEAIEGLDTFYDLQMTEGITNTNKLKFTSEPNVYHDVAEVAAFGLGTKTELSKAVFVNHSGSAVTVSLDNTKLKPYWQYGNGDDPIPDFASEPFATWRDNPQVNPEAVKLTGDFQDTAVIPPYSAVIADVKADMTAIDAARVESRDPVYIQKRLKDAIVLKLDSAAALKKGQPVSLDNDNAEVKPIMKDGRVFVPLRFIAENFGALVKWDEDTQTASVTLDAACEAHVTIGADEMQILGNTRNEKRKIDAAAFTQDGRTYIPLRALSEALNKSVHWDERGFAVVTPFAVVEEIDKPYLEKLYEKLK